MQLITPDIGLIFWMLFSFLIVFFLLKKFAWKPILQILHAREEKIDQALKSAENAKNEMEQLKADNRKILEEARQERDRIFREAQELKDNIIAEARDEARKEKDRIIAETRDLVIAEKKNAIKELREETATLSIQIAEKLLQKELSSDKDQKELIDKMIRELSLLS